MFTHIVVHKHTAVGNLDFQHIDSHECWCHPIILPSPGCVSSEEFQEAKARQQEIEFFRIRGPYLH